MEERLLLLKEMSIVAEATSKALGPENMKNKLREELDKLV